MHFRESQSFWIKKVRSRLSRRYYLSVCRIVSIHPLQSHVTQNKMLCVNGFEVLDLRKWYGWYCIGKWIRRIYNDMAIYQSLRLEKILDFTLTVDFLDTVYEVDWTHGLNVSLNRVAQQKISHMARGLLKAWRQKWGGYLVQLSGWSLFPDENILISERLQMQHTYECWIDY